MLETINPQSFSPAIKSMKASQDQIIDRAETDGILKDIFEYLKQHPKFVGLEGVSSASAVKTPSSNAANEKPSS